MRKFNLLAVIMLAMVSLTTTAYGQVAAPRLIQGNSMNGATLPFNMTSFAGASYLDLTVESTPSGQATEERGSGSGFGVSAIFSNETFGVGIDLFKVDIDNAPPPVNDGLTNTVKGNAVGLGGKMGDSLGLGVSLESEEYSSANQTVKFSLPSLGVTWKMGEMFFLGGTYGTQNVEYSDPTNPSSKVDADQTVSRVGAGLYTRDNESGFHAEVYRQLNELLELRDKATSTLFFAEESETIGVVLEGRFSNFVIGVEQSTETLDELDPGRTPPLQTSEIKTLDLTLGWSPQEGLGLLVGVSNEETTAENGDVETVSITGVSLFFVF